jgi:cellulose synthase/poly-beta-1,6-N-acetylglucosamine synthase-like glycosyltransferase
VIIVQIIFWGSILLILHSYVIFPFLLAYLSKEKRINDVVYEEEVEALPYVDIILSAYNEEAVIERKIESTFNTSYPISKIKFFIGSDASTDKTDEIIKRLQQKYSSIVFKRFNRSGKIQIVNQLVNSSSSNIIILTDANVYFTRDTIYHLVKHFKNETIGIVGGNVFNEERKTDGVSQQEGSYLKRENQIKYQEGIWKGVMIGAYGACYSMRRELYTMIPSNFLVDDFYLTMNVYKKDFKGILEPNAVAYEEMSTKISEEFRRKSRISAGNFQNLFYFKGLLWHPFTPLSFCFFSHKVLRWKTPFLIIIIFLSNLLLWKVNELYLIALLGQSALLLIPLFDWVLKNININFKLLRFITHFYGMNLALLLGFIKYISGVKSSVWKPTERNQ